MALSSTPVPPGYHTLTPSLTFKNTPAAIEWYKRALGAQVLMSFPGPGGQIMHAEVQIGDSRVMMHDNMGGVSMPSPKTLSPAGLFVYVNDCDALYNQAVQAGAKVVMPMADMFWGDRCGNIADPFGYVWAIASHQEDLTPEEMGARQEVWLKEMAAMQAQQAAAKPKAAKKKVPTKKKAPAKKAAKTAPAPRAAAKKKPVAKKTAKAKPKR